jgi:hypothetical protein
MKLIEDWARKWWRLWSVRLNAIGLGILGWVQFDPVGAIAVWNMMPPDVRRVLPPNIVTLIGLALFGLSMLARVVAQPKLERKPDGPA